MDKDIIINLDKGSFADFLVKDSSGQILELLDESGINILKKYPDVENRICYILCYSRYCNELLKKDDFLEFFLGTNIGSYYGSLSNLNSDTYDYIIKKCILLGKDNYFIGKIFTYFSSEYKINCIEKWEYSIDLLYEIFKQNMDLLGPIIINKYNINLLSHDINIESLFEVGKLLSLKNVESINSGKGSIRTLDIPAYMINKDLAEYLWKNNNVYKCRKIINDAMYSCDTSLLNECIRCRENEVITGFNKGNLLEPFNEIYALTQKLYELNRLNELPDEYYDIRMRRIKLLNSLDNYVYDKICTINIDNLTELHNVLYELCNNTLSNYIIDYHFQENYHNIMYDVRELLNFYYAGNFNLTEEKRDLYFKIANIDYLSVDEKKDLHEELKQYNMLEMFYDDMSYARQIVRTSICNNALTKKELLKYRDEELSEEYGVDVYNISDNPFYAIVKTGSHLVDAMPTGHSYSLVGTGCIAVFGDINDSSTFLYNSEKLNPNQIVHIYPRDSYTLYRPFNSVAESTNRIEPLMTLDELLHESSYYYNEMLVLEAGKNKTDIDVEIPKLEKMALFCYDKIKSGDVESAKINGVGIALINSGSQKISAEMPSSVHRHDIDYLNYNYFNGIYETEKHEKNR